ncbi:hypothetical protein CYFUS_002809 [Cystobacter fuscus]|uniref:DUF192 domain-containing protein n=1 Tax=Cystobacter fuscus TaxID=43 RepID=A0A250J1R2_9BACT|nr:DUF192 domain-containing protein [Cystobacter fuscus]ATB37387.1 hypothetical protein CYFUS_002809 [Cystobacter fuscus]
MNRRHGAWGLGVVVGLTCCRPAEARDKVEHQKVEHPTARKVKHQQVKHQDGEDDVGPTLPRARVLLEDVSGGVQVVDVEVAATPDTRSRGLMWRKELPEGQGMLFIFPDEEVQRFWMRNTLIPLDMIFINSAGRVVGIIENAAPRSLVQRFVSEPGRYVLEVPGGWSRKVGLARGGHVRFEGVERIPVIP